MSALVSTSLTFVTSGDVIASFREVTKSAQPSSLQDDVEVQECEWKDMVPLNTLNDSLKYSMTNITSTQRPKMWKQLLLNNFDHSDYSLKLQVEHTRTDR